MCRSDKCKKENFTNYTQPFDKTDSLNIGLVGYHINKIGDEMNTNKLIKILRLQQDKRTIKRILKIISKSIPEERKI
jgi:hypothetical protein